ncbi:MAG: hypothetical protein WCI52_03285 [bacterium]
MKKGFSLAETIVYIALLAIIFIVVINSLVAIMSSYYSIKSSRDIENSAMLGLDRIERDIKNSSNIAAISTSTNPNSITLNTFDSDNNPLVVRFYVSSGTLLVDENGSYSGPLSDSDVTVSSLLFSPISTGNSSGVKIQMTLQSGTSSAFKSKNFYDTAVMRGSY